MSLEEVYYVSQTIAAVAVFGSVVYLALQTRQAARNQRAQMHDSRAQSLFEAIQKTVEPEVHGLLMAGGKADPTMDASQTLRFALYAFSYFLVWEEQFRQWRDGMLDSARWGSSELFLKEHLAQPGWRAACRQFLPRADADFAALLRRLLDQLDASPPATLNTGEAWKALAAQEREAMVASR